MKRQHEEEEATIGSEDAKRQRTEPRVVTRVLASVAAGRITSAPVERCPSAVFGVVAQYLNSYGFVAFALASAGCLALTRVHHVHPYHLVLDDTVTSTPAELPPTLVAMRPVSLVVIIANNSPAITVNSRLYNSMCMYLRHQHQLRHLHIVPAMYADGIRLENSIVRGLLRASRGLVSYKGPAGDDNVNDLPNTLQHMELFIIRTHMASWTMRVFPALRSLVVRKLAAPRPDLRWIGNQTTLVHLEIHGRYLPPFSVIPRLTALQSLLIDTESGPGDDMYYNLHADPIMWHLGELRVLAHLHTLKMYNCVEYVIGDTHIPSLRHLTVVTQWRRKAVFQSPSFDHILKKNPQLETITHAVFSVGKGKRLPCLIKLGAKESLPVFPNIQRVTSNRMRITADAAKKLFPRGTVFAVSPATRAIKSIGFDLPNLKLPVLLGYN
jgi:hypothetical protein